MLGSRIEELLASEMEANGGFAVITMRLNKDNCYLMMKKKILWMKVSLSPKYRVGTKEWPPSNI